MDKTTLAAILEAALPNYLTGLTTSASNATLSFNISAGVCADSSNVAMLWNSTSISKASGAWTAGTGLGGLDTGTIAASTWYYIWVIGKSSDPGSFDALYSLSSTTPTMPSGWNLKRRVGAIKTNTSSQFVGFTQFGDDFIWSTNAASVTDINFNPTSTLGSRAVNVPPSITVLARCRGWAQNGPATATAFTVSSPFESFLSVASGSYPATAFINSPSGSDGVQAFSIDVLTNNGSVEMVASDSSASNLIRLTAYAWRDRRGQDG